MEEEAPARRSVAELAGKFKGSTRPHDAAGNETQEKPVRRRPPRSLQLPKTQGEDQEPPGVTSPLPTKAKRNSALIEKLQANLALSPTAMLPSPKSPGFRLLPPAFTPTSTGPDPVSTVTTSSTVTPTSPVTAVTPLTEEEGPASFEAPPTAAEGSILSNSSIKGRARHSLRRRPPSRRHRKSSSGDDVAIEGGDVSLSSPTEPEDKTTGGGGEEEAGGEVCEKESKIDESEKDKTSTCPEKNESHKEDESKISVESREEDGEKKEGPVGGEEGDGASSDRKEEEEKEEEEEEKEKEKEEEKNSAETETEETTEGANTDSKEEEKNEETTS